MENYIDLLIIYVFSLLTFVLFAMDKHFAIYNKTRVPELLLLLFSFLGGAFGALCSMMFFRHKTRHTKFLICIPVILLLQVTVDVVYRVFVLQLT